MAEIARLVIKVPSNTITKRSSDYLNVGIDFDYQGLEQKITFTAVVTQEVWWGEFDEIGSTRKVIYGNVPTTDVLTKYKTGVPDLPLAGVTPKDTPYGIKVIAEGTFGKVEAGNKACLYVKETLPTTLSVRLKNAPAGDFWQLLISNKSKTSTAFGQNIPMVGMVTFSNIPATWDFPLFIDLVVFQKIDEVATQVYRTQSYWGADHEYYSPITIPSLGNYYFNFSTEQFEAY